MRRSTDREKVGRGLTAAVAAAATLLSVVACSGPESALPSPSGYVRPSSGVSTTSPSPRPTASAADSHVPVVPIVNTDPRAQLAELDSVPVHLDVASVGISMPVVPVAVDDKGDMAIPASVGEVGWYEFGARPGDSTGTAVLAAHVDSFKDGLGPFARLRAIRKGAKITVRNQPGSSVRYEVTDVALVDKNTVSFADVFQRDGAPRLILITCGGSYSRGTGYSGNVIVTALPAPVR